MNRSWLLALVVLFVGCTDSSSEANVAPAQPGEATSTIAEENDTTISSTAADDPPETTVSVAPLRPYDDAPRATTEQVDASVYITRVAMSATSIEMKWSTHESAAEYHLHRLPRTSERSPEPEAMTAETRIHVADDAGRFVDEGVESGVRYWYGLRALDTDGDAVAHGWHRTAAVTDTEPPSPVGALTAVFDNGEVVVTWNRPDENYELHGYEVFRGENGEDLEKFVTTWNLEQTSFVDDSLPAGGRVTYGVVAFDFHWNDSDLVQVDVDLG